MEPNYNPFENSPEGEEHKEQQKTVKWLKENAKDMSFDSVIDDLKTLSPLVPYSFDYNEVEYSFSYDNGITIHLF